MTNKLPFTQSPNGNIANPNPKKQISQRQYAANRASAQKSTGPKTLAGKQRVRFNSLKHGLTATQVCLPGESRAEYDQRRQEYAEHFQPAGLIEWDILDDLVAARWRKERSIKYEKCLLLNTFMRRRPEIEKEYESISLDAEAALAFHELSADTHLLKLLDRYETRVMNNILGEWKLLEHARQNRPPALDDEGPSLATGTEQFAPPLRNKANPENEHLEDHRSEDDQPETPATPASPDPQPVGNAIQPATIVLRRTQPAAIPATTAPQALLQCTAST